MTFTYSVQWVPTDTPFARRFERYLDYSFFEHKVGQHTVLEVPAAGRAACEPIDLVLCKVGSLFSGSLIAMGAGMLHVLQGLLQCKFCTVCRGTLSTSYTASS